MGFDYSTFLHMEIIMNKLKLAIAAILGLGVLSTPAIAKPQVDFSIGVTNRPNYYSREYRDFRGYYNSQSHYRFYPRCARWEVAIRNPYRPGRWVCIDRDIYNDWRHSVRRGYRY